MNANSSDPPETFIFLPKQNRLPFVTVPPGRSKHNNFPFRFSFLAIVGDFTSLVRGLNLYMLVIFLFFDLLYVMN